MELALLVKWLEDVQFYFMGFCSVLVPGICLVGTALPLLLAHTMRWAGNFIQHLLWPFWYWDDCCCFFGGFWEAPTSFCPPISRAASAASNHSPSGGQAGSQWRHRTLNLFQPVSHWHFSTDVTSCWNFIAAAKNNSPSHPPPYSK